MNRCRSVATRSASTPAGKRRTTAGSPTPAVERPGSILVFDGDCGFCTRSALWAERRLGCEADPWQTLDLEALGLTRDDVTTAAWWVDEHGNRFGGHEAAARVLIRAGLPWSPLGRFLLRPGVAPLAARAYALIAANRHRLPGSTDACRVTDVNP